LLEDKIGDSFVYQNNKTTAFFERSFFMRWHFFADIDIDFLVLWFAMPFIARKL